MPSKAVASASTSAKRSRDNGSNKFRDRNVLCVLDAHCDDAQLAQLLVQHRLIAKQSRCVRHENANNPDKGHRLGNENFRIFNFVLAASANRSHQQELQHVNPLLYHGNTLLHVVKEHLKGSVANRFHYVHLQPQSFRLRDV
jgi:hypothetical protein